MSKDSIVIPDIYHAGAKDKQLLFGAFPQDLKFPSVTVSEEPEPCGYYLGSDGAYYAKWKANPHSDHYAFKSGEPIEKDKVYWFKVQPIKWRVLNVTDGVAVLFADEILATCAYLFGNYPVLAGMERENYLMCGEENEYAQSGVRRWIIRDFFLAAFTPEEQEHILTTKVDNSVASTNEKWSRYACEDTEDKVFLLSAAEIVSKTFGVDMLTEESTEAYKIPSDFARAMGASRMCAEGFSPWRGNILNEDPYAWWWTRSPSPDYADSAKACDGAMIGIHDCLNASGGVCPAIRIRLE